MIINILKRLCFVMLLFSAAVYANITGTAFKDYNADGTQQGGEPGVGGIVVKAYKDDGAGAESLAAQTTTANDGSYSLDTKGVYPVRLEFILPDNGCMVKKGVDFPSAGGENYGTSVQFAKADGEVHNFAVSYPSDFSTQDNPYTFAPIMINGNPTSNGTTASAPALAKFHFKDEGHAANSGRGEDDGPAWIELVKQNQIGTTFGNAYSRQARKIFLSAFMKRHTGFGPLGTGGIYMIDPDKNSSQQGNVQFLNLDDLGIETSDHSKSYTNALSSDNHVDFSPVAGSNSDRGLPDDFDQPSQDSAAYGQVGRLSLGDMEISDDGRYLYVANLYKKNIVQIDLTNPKNPVAPTKDNASQKIKEYTPPNPCSENGNNYGEMIPFALKVYKGELYVGITCTGADKNGTAVVADNSGMKGFIYHLNLSDGTTWSKDVEWSFDYRNNDGSGKPWNLWTNDWNGDVRYPIPLVGDIEFDNAGDIVVGILDTQGNKKGESNYDLNGEGSYNGIQTGDIIKFVKNPETCEYNVDLSKEFYDDDKVHDECAGSVLAGHHTSDNDLLMTTFMDPLDKSAYGTMIYDNKTGDRANDGYEVIYKKRSHLGKANALGDIETMEFVPPIEIGNLVWDDKDKDGIQDAGESGIKDVKVFLSQGNDCSNKIAETTTDANGNYIFNYANVNPNSNNPGLQADTNYTVCIDKSQFDSGKGVNGTPLEGLTLTSKNQQGKSDNPDRTDSDADVNVNGYAYISVHTKKAGENDHSFDFGFAKKAESCIGDYVWIDKNINGIQDDGELGVGGVKVTLKKDGADFNTTVTADDGKYQFCGLKAGTYQVVFDLSTLPQNYKVTIQNAGNDDNKDSDANPTSGETDKVTIEKDGDPDILNIDMGIYKMPCVGDYVWEDKNGNGIQDSDESGVNGVSVKLLDSSGKELNSTTTATKDGKKGYYEFCNLNANTEYKVKFDINNSYKISPANQGDDTKDSDVNKSSKEAPATIANDDNMTIDAGIYKPACIGNRIWLDKNANGIQDSGESNLNESVKVTLLDKDGNSVKDANGNEVAPIQTSNGNYKFCNLVPGDYKVKVTPPTGYFISPKDKTGNTDDDNNNTNDDSDIDPSSGETVSVHLDSGEEDLTWDAGVFKPACIGDYIWEDKNANGLQEAGESGIAGATVTLLDKDGNAVTSNAKNQPIDPITTVANGKYEFCNLVPGKYMLEVTPPTDYLLTYQDKSGSSNDNGANNTNDDSDINITTHKSVVVELSSDENDTTWDAGVFKPACLGDYTWLDDNANGIQDDNKSLDGVNVTVLDKDGNPVTVGADGTTYSNTQVTGKVNGEPEGKYHFCNLRPGEYMVKFQKDPDSTGAPFISTDKDKGGDDNKDSDIPKFQDAKNGLVSDKVVLESGDDNRSIDAGFVQELCLGDYVWEDTNANGIQENGEPALANVPVKLMMDNGNGWEDAKDVKGNPVDANQTDENGKYKFCHLKPAIDYKIVFTKPTGYYVTDKDADNNSKDANDSDIAEDSTIVVKKPVRDDMSLDAGFFRPACIGDLVWEDKNGNGIQDADELGLDGVKVELLENNSTDITNVDGEKIGALITKDGGKYHFACKIKPGKYSLRFTTPDGYYFTKKDVASSTDSNDSDVEQFKAKVGTTKTTELTSGEDDLTWDAGVFKPACIGDYIWDDLNANGIQDEGEVAPMDDSNNTVPVNITLETIASGYDKDLDGNALNTTISDSGEYKFCKLVPGTYRVKVTVPANWYVTRRDKGDDDSKDSDMGAFLDTNKDVTMPSEELESGENNMTFDGGMFKPSCLGSTVWEDKNANGIKDDGEPGIKDVNVTLLPYEDDYGYENNMTVERQAFQTIQTDEDGKYQFCGLIPGKYRVMFEAPANADGTPRFTTGQNQGSDDKDSDAQEYKDGKVITAPVTVNSRANNQTVFAGYVKELCLGDYVWYDKNLNGTQDRNEPGVIGVNVHLTYADGTAVTDVNGDIVNVTQTNSKGKYSFCHLKPGKDYKIKFDVPESYHPTLQNRGGDTQDSDTNENGVIVVKKAVKDDYSNDLGIYCDCDDYKVNPQNHKELKAPALGIFGLFIMIFTLFTIARKER